MGWVQNVVQFDSFSMRALERWEEREEYISGAPVNAPGKYWTVKYVVENYCSLFSFETFKTNENTKYGKSKYNKNWCDLGMGFEDDMSVNIIFYFYFI